METRKHHKLVRDGIPEIIRANGDHAEFDTFDDQDYIVALKQKLCEEAREAADAPSVSSLIAELADVQEVIRALAEAEGFSLKEIETRRTEKERERGAFRRKVLLITTQRMK